MIWKAQYRAESAQVSPSVGGVIYSLCNLYSFTLLLKKTEKSAKIISFQIIWDSSDL